MREGAAPHASAEVGETAPFGVLLPFSSCSFFRAAPDRDAFGSLHARKGSDEGRRAVKVLPFAWS